MCFIDTASVGYRPQVVPRCFQIAIYIPDTIYVDDDAPPGWYDSVHVQTIQEGIDSVAEGGMVYVHNGTYYENPILEKRLYLIGQSMDSVVVDGSGGDVFTISAEGVQISGFTVQSGGSGKGIVVYLRDNSIWGNNIKDADYGIWMADSASPNFIFHNNFLNNAIRHAYGLGVNIWDHGYPSGGNYWDDYAGADDYYGPNQDVPGSDGIGDTAYIPTWVANKDRYPLMNPWIGTSPVPPVDTAWVDDDYDENTPGWGFDRFDNIQDGINAVISGGVVLVFNGTYYEYITIDKTIDLIGEDRDSTIIDRESGDIVTVTADSVKISGFSILGAGPFTTDAMWLVESNYNTISDNNISDHCHGVMIYHSNGNVISDNMMISNYCGSIVLTGANGNTISGNNVEKSFVNLQSGSSNNTVSGNTIIGENIHALRLQSWSLGNTISGNTIITDYWDGIHLLLYSDDNVITGNTITSITLGGSGVYIEQCYNNTVYKNNISNQNIGIQIASGDHNSVDSCTIQTNHCGISIIEGNDNMITLSVIDSNDVGVHIENADSNAIKWCKIEDNTGYGIELVGASNTSIWSNNLIANNGATSTYDTAHIQAYDDSLDANFWNAEYPTGGNYWSDYDGSDTLSGPDQNLPGSDGIGDTPYPLHPLEVGNQDNYPLMAPWAVVCGDCNCDGEVTVSDAVYLIGYLLKSGPEPLPHWCAGNANGDVKTNIEDIVYLIGYLFRSGSPPVPGCCGGLL